MPDFTFCQNFLEKSLVGIHKKRVDSLTNATCALLKGGTLSITGLARARPGKAKRRSKIRMISRFLSNSEGIYKEQNEVYKGVANNLLAGLEQIRIAVDWSGCCTSDFFLLRASLLHKGRSIPIYNEIHPSIDQENDAVHKKFLVNLKKILPANRTIIIITDGGFKTPWFQSIASFGWRYVGRVRGRIKYSLDEGSSWNYIKDAHKYAKQNKIIDLGIGSLGKTTKTQLKCRFFVYKETPKGRKKKKQKGKSIFPDAEKMYSAMNREPWIIVTNVDEDFLKKNKNLSANLGSFIVQCYKKRMQIEQNFRDDKSPRWGFGWRYSRTDNIVTLAMLCLVATITTILLWLIGFYAEHKKWQYEFQANSIKNKRVLSFIFLAKEIIFSQRYKITSKIIKEAIMLFHNAYYLDTEEIQQAYPLRSEK